MTDSLDDLKLDRQGELHSSLSDGSGICRDFVRGVCSRKFCKFRHESEMLALKFCHDFQNATCPRPNCKFIHCSPDEEDEYKKTGELSNRILAEATRKAQLPGTHPVCNQFRKGACRRVACKYRHISKEEEEVEIMDLVQNSSGSAPSTFEVGPDLILNNNMDGTQSKLLITTSTGLAHWNGVEIDEADVPSPPVKRRFIASSSGLEYIGSGNCGPRPLFRGYFAGNPPILNGVDTRTIMLEEENSLLHKEIEQLKRQVSDLTATNEFLLDQNATLRMSNKRNGAVTVPSVSITNTLPPNNSTPQAQQMIRTVTASVATVPVSIATVTTGAPISIAACPAVSIAPAQILAPSQQIIVTNTPSQLAIAHQCANNLAAAAQSQQQLTSQAQQIALANTQQQQLTSQSQQLTSQSQQLVLAAAAAAAAGTGQQQLTSQAQQLTLANPPPRIALTSTGQQLLAQQNLAATQQLSHPINTSQPLSNTTQPPLVSYPIMTQTISHALTH